MSQGLFGKHVSNGTGLFSWIDSWTVGLPVGGGAWQSVQIHSQMCDSTQQNQEMSEVQEDSWGDVEAILEGQGFYQDRETHPRRR